MTDSTLGEGDEVVVVRSPYEDVPDFTEGTIVKRFGNGFAKVDLDHPKYDRLDFRLANLQRKKPKQ